MREQGISLLLNGNLRTMEFISQKQGEKIEIFELREHVTPWEALPAQQGRSRK